MKLCLHCRQPIELIRRSDTLYCKRKCRKVAYNQKLLTPELCPALPEALAQVRQTLIAHSTADEIGYQLGWLVQAPQEDAEAAPQPPQAIWLPPTQGRSKRFDGRFDDRPFFELRPRFEPPRVPKPGLYQVRFVGPGGLIVQPPYALSGGLYIPVGTPMCLPGKKHIARHRPRQLY